MEWRLRSALLAGAAVLMWFVRDKSDQTARGTFSRRWMAPSFVLLSLVAWAQSGESGLMKRAIPLIVTIAVVAAIADWLRLRRLQIEKKT